jgi:hypothetical protein
VQVVGLTHQPVGITAATDEEAPKFIRQQLQSERRPTLFLGTAASQSPQASTDRDSPASRAASMASAAAWLAFAAARQRSPCRPSRPPILA